MGSKVEKHLSRLAMPKSWKVKRKGLKWVTRPLPGPHPFEAGVPLILILRDMLGYAGTEREVKSILNSHEVLVDGVRRKESKFIVGVMDVFAVPKINKYFRILINKKGYIVPVAIDKHEANIKICKITGKTAIKKGKLQLNLHDGRNILTDEKSFKIGDSLLIELPSQKIREVIQLTKGSIVYLSRGKHQGEIGIVEEIKGDKIVFKKGNELFETVKNYAFAVGKEKPLIKLPE